MSKIIYSKKLTTDGACKKFFSIPVKPVKVMMRYSDKPQLNHFERAVLTLLLHSFYSIADLSEKLELQKELVELIENNLKKKGFLDGKTRVTQEGINAVKGVYADYTDRVCYVFYDINREMLITEFCKGSDIVITEGEKYSFLLENDAYSEEVNFRPIRINRNKILLKDELIKSAIKRDVFTSADQNLVSVKVLEIDAYTYDLISYVETDEKTKETKWSVKNPITLEQDTALYDFFYRNSDNEEISKMILNIMEFRKNSCVTSETDKRIYETIKTRLFDKEVKGIHEDFIIPLISVIKVLDGAESAYYDEKIARINIIKEAMTEMGDLFEKITWQAAMESTIEAQMYYEKVLKRNKENNKILLEEFAKSIGFDIGEDSRKLLYVDMKVIEKCMKKPDCVQLSECISWGLTIAMVDTHFYLRRIAKKYPNFISLLYRFKRDYRDRNKHTTMVELVSPKMYIDLLWDLLDETFGYKVNKKVLEELVTTGNKIYDYSYAYEKLRVEMGNRLFESSDEQLARIKLSLISMYEAYVTKRCTYLSEAYKLIDESVLLIAKKLQQNFDCTYTSLQDLFENKNQIVDFLKERGFNTTPHCEIGNDLAGALDFIGVAGNVEKGFSNDFDNAVLRVKLLAIVDMLHEKQECMAVFDNYKDLFVTASTLSYLQRHQQEHEFDEIVAELVVDDVMAVVKFVIDEIVEKE